MDHVMNLKALDATVDAEIPNIPGWCTPEKAKKMARLAFESPLCIELGVFGGRGLVAIALGLREKGIGRVDGIDPFTAAAALEGTNDPANDEWWAKLDYESIARVAQKKLYELDLVHYAHLIRMASHEVADYYKDGTVDLLHQDSNHSEEISCKEVELWVPKIRSRGYWVFDDTDWPTTLLAQKILAASGFEMIEDHETWKVFRKL